MKNETIDESDNMVCIQLRQVLQVAALLLSALASPVFAAETQIQYLSGTGKDDPIKWDFYCTAGQNSNQWSTIDVPSNWEPRVRDLQLRPRCESLRLAGGSGSLQANIHATGAVVEPQG